MRVANPFGEQQPPGPGPLSRIFKISERFCQQAFFSGGKQAEFWMGGLNLNGSYKDLAIQALNVLSHIAPAWLVEKEFNVLVIIKTKEKVVC